MPPSTYSIDEAQELTRQAAKAISDTQPEVWGMPEWNICHHLANELAKKFEGFNLDVELRKQDGRRPDIVVHQRGHNENNLIVFQVKIKPSTASIQEDLDKIRNTFFQEPYSYKYGIFLSVGKLPDPLPELDKSRIRIVEVYGWARMTNEEFEERKRQR